MKILDHPIVSSGETLFPDGHGTQTPDRVIVFANNITTDGVPVEPTEPGIGIFLEQKYYDPSKQDFCMEAYLQVVFPQETKDGKSYFPTKRPVFISINHRTKTVQLRFAADSYQLLADSSANKPLCNIFPVGGVIELFMALKDWMLKLRVK